MIIRRVIFEILGDDIYSTYIPHPLHETFNICVELANGKIINYRQMIPIDHFNSMFDIVMDSIKHEIKKTIKKETNNNDETWRK